MQQESFKQLVANRGCRLKTPENASCFRFSLVLMLFITVSLDFLFDGFITRNLFETYNSMNTLDFNNPDEFTLSIGSGLIGYQDRTFRSIDISGSNFTVSWR